MQLPLTSSELSINTQEQENALSNVIEYYLSNKDHISGKKELIKQLGLFVIALSGAGLYATAADAYAESEHVDLAGRINYMVCTCAPALVVLYNSTDLFFRMRAAEKTPKELAAYFIHRSTPVQRTLQDIAITLGAAISALPLAAVSFMYPIPGLPKAALYTQGLVVLFDNTILHFLPIKLALQNPWYRLPALPLEYIFERIKHCSLSNEQKNLLQLKVQQDSYYRVIKQRLITRLDHIQTSIVIHGFSFDAKRLRYINHAALELKRLNQERRSSFAMLEELLQWKGIAPEKNSTSTSLLNSLFKKSCYPVGAAWVISSCVGYLAAPINELSNLTGSKSAGVLLSIPSIYFLGVLLAFFGGSSLQNLYHYFTSWKGDSIKIPIEFKLYPRATVLLVVLSIYLSVFSYAAAAELINDNFTGELEFLRPYLLVLAKTGLAFLGFTAMLDFYALILGKLARYAGNEDSKIVILLNQSIEQLKNGIQRMDPEQLLESLAQLNENGYDIKSLLNLHGASEQRDFIQMLLKLQQCQHPCENNSEVINKLILAVDKSYDMDNDRINNASSESTLLIPKVKARSSHCFSSLSSFFSLSKPNGLLHSVSQDADQLSITPDFSDSSSTLALGGV
ncbi:MAG: hypothetical protein V4471_07465 [Pseudomonadota bacterium]